MAPVRSVLAADDILMSEWDRRESTWGVCGFEDPVCIFCVSDCLASPFDLKMAWRLFEKWGTGKGMDVELGLGRHS